MTARIFKSDQYFLVVIMDGHSIDRIVKITQDSAEADRIYHAINVCLNAGLSFNDE